MPLSHVALNPKPSKPLPVHHETWRHANAGCRTHGKMYARRGEDSVMQGAGGSLGKG